MVHNVNNEAHLLNTDDLQAVPKQMDAWLDSKREGLDCSLPYVGQVAFTFGLGYAGARTYQLVRRNKRRVLCPLKFVAGAFILGNVARFAFAQGHHHHHHHACPFTAKRSSDEHNTTPTPESSTHRACPFTAKPSPAAEPGTTTSSESNGHRHRHHHHACPFTAMRASAGEATSTDQPPCPSTSIRNQLASGLDALHLGVINDKLGHSGLPDGPSAVAAASLGIWWGLRVM